MTIPRTCDAICACCGRQAEGYGYAPRMNQQPLWVCDDPLCLPTAKDTFNMKQDQFNRIESLAAQKGGEEAGMFLDEIGKTDLATLTVDEYCEFNRRHTAGYRKALASSLREEAPF